MKFGDIKTKALSQALFDQGLAFLWGRAKECGRRQPAGAKPQRPVAEPRVRLFAPNGGKKPWLPPWERGVSAGVAPYGAVPQVPRAVLCRHQRRRTFLPLPLGEVAQRSCDGEGPVCRALATAGSVELIGNGFMTCLILLRFAPTENRPRKLPIRS